MLEPTKWRLPQPSASELDVLFSPDCVGGKPAWQQLIKAGALVPVWDEVAVPNACQITSSIRARAIASLVPEHCIVAGLSAAWVLVGTLTPPTLEIVYAPGRHRPPSHRARKSRQAAILHSETQRIAQIQVTGPVRTALDVAAHTPGEVAVPTVQALCQLADLDLSVAARSLELRYRWPNRDRVRQVFSRVALGRADH